MTRFETQKPFYKIIDNDFIKKLSPIFYKIQIDELFPEKQKILKLDSSYRSHYYHYLFFAIVLHYQIEKAVELGVLSGFSLLSMSSAFKAQGNGKVDAYDLFEDYEFRSDKQELVEKRIREVGLEKYAELHKSDAFEVANLYRKTELLHVDLSNNGDVIERIFEQWHKKVRKIIIFEGGSDERDRVHWMTKYEKPSLKKAINRLRLTHPEWTFIVLNPFPSLTLAIRK